MNKKGTIIHWIIFGVFAALGTVFLFSSSSGFDLHPYGTWQASLIHVQQDAEVNLMYLNQVARVAASDAVNNYQQKIFENDVGCGLFAGLPLWNSDQFCVEQMDIEYLELFKKSFQEKVTTPHNLNYDNTGQFILGKSEQKLKIIEKPVNAKLDSASPYLRQIASLPPFKTEYEVSSAFRIALPEEFIEIKETIDFARLLYLACKNKQDLKACLDKNRRDLKYFNCLTDSPYQEDGRKVIFCKDGEKFVLEFVPQTEIK